MMLIAKKAVKAAALTAMVMGVSVSAFAQSASNPTQGTVNSDVTASTTTGASSTMAGHHTRKSSTKHKSAMGAQAASQ